MRYQTAVINLLQRIAKNSNELRSRLPPRSFTTLTHFTLVQCSRFSMGWFSEKGDMKGPRDRETVSMGHAVSYVDNEFWGRLGDHVPTFLLFIELTRLDGLSGGASLKRDGLVRRILYSVPGRGCSTQVHGLFRAIIVNLIPERLDTATTAYLIGCFAVLTAIHAAHEDSHKKRRLPREATEHVESSTERRNREVAAAMAKVPSVLAEHLIIRDDTALMQQIVEEITRRLPPAGETLTGDYLQTLIEGSITPSGDIISPSYAYTFHNMQWHSTTTAVTREEFTALLSKLVFMEGRAATKNKARVQSENHNAGVRDCERLRPHLHSPAAVKAFANAIPQLCLVSRIKDVVAARSIFFGEWLFLVSVATSLEESWAAAVLPALHVALEAAEAERRDRMARATEAGLEGTDETLFPQFSEGDLCWILRVYASGLYCVRHDPARVQRIVGATKPLLSEYLRQLRKATSASAATLFADYSGLQCLWTLLRTFGLSSCQRPWLQSRQDAAAAHEDDVDDDEHGDFSFVLQTSSQGVSEQEKIGLLAAVVAVGDAYVGQLGGKQKTTAAVAAATASASPAPPPESASTANENVQKKKRGAGFGKTALRVPPKRERASESRRSEEGLLRGEDTDTTQLFMEFKISYCLRLLRYNALTLQDYRAAVATAFTTLTETNILFPALTTTAFFDRYKLRVSAFREGNTTPADEQRILISFLSGQKTNDLFLLWELLKPSTAHTLLPEERLEALRHFARIFDHVTELLLLASNSSVVSHGLSMLVQRLFELHRIIAEPVYAAEVAADDASHPSHVLRRAVQRLSVTALEALDKMWSTSHSSRKAQWSMASASGSFLRGRSPQLAVVRMADAAMMLGADAGLTSSELPHFASSAKHMIDALMDLAAVVTASMAVNREATAATQECSQLLYILTTRLHHLCALGLNDEASLMAIAKALRVCGTDDFVRYMRPYRRCGLMVNVVNIFRVLAPRYSTSRATRTVMAQLLLVAERLGSDRLAFEGLNNTKDSVKLLAGDGNVLVALMMWQLSCYALPFVGSSATVDRCVRSLQQFAKRHLVVLTCHDYSPPSSPVGIDHMEYCEEVFRSCTERDKGLFRIEVPQTPRGVVLLANTLFASVEDGARSIYNHLFSEQGTTPTPAQRLSWLAHAETFLTLADRFQDVVAPSLWHRCLRECWQLQVIFSTSNLTTPLLNPVLILALERVLLYTKAHNNRGQWARSRLIEAGGTQPGETPHIAIVDSEKLITFQVAARYFLFQEAIPTMALRVYLVELLDSLVQEHKDVVVSEVTNTSRTRSFFIRDDAESVNKSMLRSGRLSICSSFRKMML